MMRKDRELLLSKMSSLIQQMKSSGGDQNLKKFEEQLKTAHLQNAQLNSETESLRDSVKDVAEKCHQYEVR